MKPMIIAIDGPSGVGKSTLGLALAARLGCSFVESGAMYRAVALAVLQRKAAPDDSRTVAQIAQGIRIQFVDTPAGLRVHLNGCDVTERIRAADVTDAASIVSTIPRVRELMVAEQRALGDSNRGVVMEGRDIGTVVFPNADLKVYLDAAPEIRTARRLKDEEAAQALSESEVRELMDTRDQRDRTRKASPLMAADDAIHIDSSRLNAEEVLEQVWALVSARASR